MADLLSTLGGRRTPARLRTLPPGRRRTDRRLPPGRRRRPHRPRPLAAGRRRVRRPALRRPAGHGQLAPGPGVRRPRHHPAGRLEPTDHRGRPVYSVDGRLAGEAWRKLGPRSEIWDLRRRVLRRGTVVATVVVGLTLLIGSILGGAVRSTEVVTVPGRNDNPTNRLPGMPLPQESTGERQASRTRSSSDSPNSTLRRGWHPRHRARPAPGLPCDTGGQSTGQGTQPSQTQGTGQAPPQQTTPQQLPGRHSAPDPPRPAPPAATPATGGGGEPAPTGGSTSPAAKDPPRAAAAGTRSADSSADPYATRTRAGAAHPAGGPGGRRPSCAGTSSRQRGNSQARELSGAGTLRRGTDQEPWDPSSRAASVRSFAVSMARQYAPFGSGYPASRRSRASRGTWSAHGHRGPAAAS